MKKDLLVGILLGSIAGASATYMLAKKAIRKEVENEVLDELDSIEKDYDLQVKEYSDLHDYALDHNDTYKQTVQEFYEQKDRSKHTDIDATYSNVEFSAIKDAKHENVIDYRTYYEDRSVAVEEDDERVAEMDAEDEAFNEFAERMAKEKPIHYVTAEEWSNSEAKKYFDITDYIYFVKDGSVTDDAWNLQAQEDLFDALGTNWRNVLARDGHVWVIDYSIGAMYHMSCNHYHTYDSAYEKACSLGSDDSIYIDKVERIIGVSDDGDE